MVLADPQLGSFVVVNLLQFESFGLLDIPEIRARNFERTKTRCNLKNAAIDGLCFQKKTPIHERPHIRGSSIYA